MVLPRMTSRSCCKSFESADFFVFFGDVGYTTSSSFCCLGFWKSRPYNCLFFLCLAVLVIEPDCSSFRSLGCALALLNQLDCVESGAACVVFLTLVLFFAYISRCYLRFSSKIASDQPIRCLWPPQFCRRHDVSILFSFPHCSCSIPHPRGLLCRFDCSRLHFSSFAYGATFLGGPRNGFCTDYFHVVYLYCFLSC